MRRTLIAFTVLALALAGLPAAFAQGDAPAAVTLAMPAPASLDPAPLSRFDLATRDLVENLYVGLTRLNPATRQIEPMLARSWTVSDDGLTWTFDLREDISWVRVDPASGAVQAVRPVAAGDFVYAVQRACDPLRPSPLTSNIMIIRGCHTVASAFPEVITDLFIAREIGARATGPHTLEVNLMFPASFFPTLLAMPELRPLPRETADADRWSSAGALLTSGPFALAEWSARGMQLVRNPFWPDPLTGSVEEVRVQFTGEASSPLAAVQSGSAQFARLDGSQIEAARAAAPGLLRTADGAGLVMLGFSFDRAIVDVVEARRALSYALDRTALAQIFAGEMEPATGFTPGTVVAAPAGEGALDNTGLAQSSFEAAGYAGCAAIPEPLIILVPDDDPRWQALGEAVGAQWTAALGCSPRLFEVRALPRTLMIDLAHATYDPEKVTRSHVWLATWYSEYPDASGWIGDALHCEFGYVRTLRECEPADALLDRAATEPDSAARAALYQQAEDAFFGPSGSFPVAPLLWSVTAWLQAPALAGVVGAHPARFDLWTFSG